VGKTIAEKILQAHLVEKHNEIKPGEIVLAKPDVILLNDVSGPLSIKQVKNIGARKVKNVNSLVLVLDHFEPPPSLEAAQNNKVMRDFAKEQGTNKFFEIGSGIEHTLLPEMGLVKPGYLIIGGDSHTTTYGAFNAYGSGFGATDIAVAMALGYLWFRVPESQLFIFKGSRPPFITGKDLILHVIGDIGVDGANFQSMEFSGPALLNFNIDEYMHVANMAIEAGAEAGIFEPNEVIINWSKTHLGEVTNLVKADNDAKYLDVHEYDITSLEPLIAKPHSPGNVVTVKEVEGVPVNQVYIGNCANGTITDLRQAAAILRNKKISKDVRLIIMAATRNVYKQAIKEGLIDVFIDSGAQVSHSTCGACFGGHMGLLADGEVAITTTNRNFRGRMGSAKAEVYLANAMVAAASAITGYITDPRKVADWDEVKKFVYG